MYGNRMFVRIVFCSNGICSNSICSNTFVRTLFLRKLFVRNVICSNDIDIVPVLSAMQTPYLYNCCYILCCGNELHVYNNKNYQITIYVNRTCYKQLS